MQYTNDFKTKAFRIFRFTGKLLKIIKAIENNKHNQVRLLLEELVDDPKLYTNKLNRMGVRYEVKDSKKYAHQDRVDLYSEFMENYTVFLDKKKRYEVFIN